VRNVSDRNLEKVKTHMLVNFFPRKSYLLWDNVEKYSTAKQATDCNTVRRMRVACWIPKSTDTHSKSIILIVFPFNMGNVDVPLCYLDTTLPLSLKLKSCLCCCTSPPIMIRILVFWDMTLWQWLLVCLSTQCNIPPSYK
jgi:hypothetical protein